MAWKEVIHHGEPPRTWLAKAKDWVERSFSIGFTNLKDPELTRMFGYQPSSAGVSVTEESSLTYAAVWNAVSLISGHVASLPLLLYRRLPGGGKERYEQHPTFRLLHSRPNPDMPAFQFRETLQAHVLLWGNGYAEIERDTVGRPVAMYPLMPYAVTPIREGSMLKYRVRQPNGTDIVFDQRDVLHIRGLGADGIVGYSPIQKARESLSLGIATERFGATFFGNGATFGGVIKYPQGSALSPQARKDNREALERRHQGVDRAHRLLALYDGGEYTQLGIPPEDAQFLQTRKFQVEEIARWFNLPPHKIKQLDRSTYSNIEMQSIEYVTDSLMPWLRRWEAEIECKIISPLESNIQFAEFLIEGLLRGDAAGRAAFYKTMREIGAMSANEIRIRENLNPVPEGDTLWTQRPALTEGSNS